MIITKNINNFGEKIKLKIFLILYLFYKIFNYYLEDLMNKYE